MRLILSFSLVLSFVCSTACAAEQKVALVSGAGSGIGLAIVKAFQARGWKVWAGYHRTFPEELTQLENVVVCPLDVTNGLQVQAAVDTAIKVDGRIDALINNAGYGLIGAEECVTIEEAQRQFDVNFFGPLRLIQAVLPVMRQQKGGHIVNISSGVGIQALPGLGLYSASKFALEAMTDSLAATVAHWNIRVSAIEPGFVKNQWGAHCALGSRKCQEEYYRKLTRGIQQMLSIPQGQTSAEVAALVMAVVDNPHPQVRYQTSEAVSQWAAEKLVDPSGMSSYQSNLRFIEGRTAAE